MPAPIEPTVTYEIRDAAGVLQALHTRIPPRGRKKKAYVWSRPDGTKGLGGIKVADVPLYGSEQLGAVQAGGLVVVTEGEKDADALLALNIPAVGTVTGSGGCPSDEVLEILAGFEVAVWPDLARDGRAHMQKVLAGLRRVKGNSDGLSTIDGAAFGITLKGGGAADWTPVGDPTDELWGNLSAWTPPPDPTPPTDDTIPKHFMVRAGKTADGLLAAFDYLGIEPRYNMRSSQPELLTVTDYPARWEETDDMIRAALRDTMGKQCRYTTKDGPEPFAIGKNRFDDLVDAILHTRRVDPFKVWLDDLPPWDQEARIDYWIHGCFTIGDIDGDLFAWACRSVLMAAVSRTDHPGEKHDEMVVLIGPQDIGKSTAWAWLFPQQHRPDWFTDGLNFHADEKARVEALQGRVLVEAAEMSGSTRAEVESLKGFLSRTNDGSVRLTYRRDPGRLPRRCVIVGTSNDPRCLPNDPSGNRRFVGVPTRAGDTATIREFLDKHRDQLWAEAVHRVRVLKEPAYLPKHLKRIQLDANLAFQATDEFAEEVISTWLKTQPTGPVTLKQVADGIQWGNDHRSAYRITTVLKQFGYASSRRGRGGPREWVPPGDQGSLLDQIDDEEAQT